MEPHTRENLLRFQPSGWATTYASATIQWDSSPFGNPFGMTEDDLDNKTPAQIDKRLTLIKQMEMDATDLILHLIKGQPRIIKSGLYRYDNYVERVAHNYQRNTIQQNGSWVIYYKGTILCRLVRKPHTTMTVFDVGEKGQARYALGVLTKVANDLLPITIRKDT